METPITEAITRVMNKLASTVDEVNNRITGVELDIRSGILDFAEINSPTRVEIDRLKREITTQLIGLSDINIVVRETRDIIAEMASVPLNGK